MWPQGCVCSAELRSRGFWLLVLWFLSTPPGINQPGRWGAEDQQTPRLLPRSYMVGGHEIKVVAVAGVEGHDVVDGFAGGQPQRPLVGQGHVRQEGQLWKSEPESVWLVRAHMRNFFFFFFSNRVQSRGHRLELGVAAGAERCNKYFLKVNSSWKRWLRDILPHVYIKELFKYRQCKRGRSPFIKRLSWCEFRARVLFYSFPALVLGRGFTPAIHIMAAPLTLSQQLPSTKVF